MLIEPVQPVNITIKLGENEYDCRMLTLSDTELEVNCDDYLEKDTEISFIAKYFRGNAVIKEINFKQSHFIYKLEISEIQFQPGLLINTRL